MGWPGTCGKQGQGVPVGMGQPTLRVRALTDRRDGALSELADLAARVAGWSRDGEGVEVYVSRGTETEVQRLRGRRRVAVVGHLGRAPA